MNTSITNTSIEMFKELYKSTLLSLSKEELIEIIVRYRTCCFKIGETCVEESKYHIESSDAMDKIKDYLKSVDFKFYDETVLKEMLNKKAKIKI